MHVSAYIRIYKLHTCETINKTILYLPDGEVEGAG